MTPAENPRQCWATPRGLARNLCAEFGLTIDLAANEDNRVLPRFVSPEENSVGRGSVRWGPRWRGWLNPPYGDITPWVEKAHVSAIIERSTTVLLLPARVSRAPWWPQFQATARWWSFDGRIQFVPAPGVKDSSNSEGALLGVYGPDVVPGYAGLRSATTGAEVFEAPPSLAAVEVIAGGVTDKRAELARVVVLGRPKAKGRGRGQLRKITNGVAAAMLAEARKVGDDPLSFWRALNKLVFVHTPTDTAKAEKRVRDNARPFIPNPLDGPLELEVQFEFALPAKRRSDQFDGAPFRSVPDVDNLVKLVKDALTETAYGDDAEVTRIVAEKVYAKRAATTIVFRKHQPMPLAGEESEP